MEPLLVHPLPVAADLAQALDRAGYRGPIGLQCYNLKGDTETNLRRSIAAWRRFQPASVPASHR